MTDQATPHTVRQRVVILGGGIASLTTAWNLSNTEELRARFDVEVIQLGWRLGGKLASGRQLHGEWTGIPDDGRQVNDRFGQRNTEHGLHVWFGFYDNAFNLFQSAFAAWKRPPDCPWSQWDDAFTPTLFTPLGEVVDGQRKMWLFRWAGNDAQPGGDSLMSTPAQVIGELIGWISAFIADFLVERLKSEPAPDVQQAVLGKLWDRVSQDEHPLADRIAQRVGQLLDSPAPGQSSEDQSSQDASIAELERMIDSAQTAGMNAAAHTTMGLGRGLQRLAEVAALRDLEGGRAQTLTRALKLWARLTLPLIQARTDAGDVDAHHVHNLLDLGVAFVIGLLNPVYGLLSHNMDLDRIDHLEFREWLKANGADPQIVDNWSQTATLYDTMFEYIAGDLNKPNYAAGVAARVFIRIAASYKGAPLYLVNAGMGETVIAPLYEICKANGVRFRFFSKVKNLSLSADGSQVTAIDLDIQAKTQGDYQPVVPIAGLSCWPAQGPRGNNQIAVGVTVDCFLA